MLHSSIPWWERRKVKRAKSKNTPNPTDLPNEIKFGNEKLP
jgi:hypothetical protein